MPFQANGEALLTDMEIQRDCVFTRIAFPGVSMTFTCHDIRTLRVDPARLGSLEADVDAFRQSYSVPQHWKCYRTTRLGWYGIDNASGRRVHDAFFHRVDGGPEWCEINGVKQALPVETAEDVGEAVNRLARTVDDTYDDCSRKALMFVSFTYYSGLAAHERAHHAPVDTSNGTATGANAPDDPEDTGSGSDGPGVSALFPEDDDDDW